MEADTETGLLKADYSHLLQTQLCLIKHQRAAAAPGQLKKTERLPGPRLAASSPPPVSVVVAASRHQR